jgi:hydroxymethylbilane synthase
LSRVLRIGTRGSALALAQASQVARMLYADTELVTITTSGDRDRGGGDKERWVKELELALLEGEIDLAVHSAKDVPAELPVGLEIAGAPAREDPRDALCGAAALETLPPGARVGTGSLRRRAQLLARREDLDVVAVRGNVDTRLRKLAAGECDALVLALAGLRRLGREDAAQAVLDLVPAAGQGTLALEARGDDARTRAEVAAITDPDAMACLVAERALVRELGADCHTPVGAHARARPAGGWVLEAWVGRTDGGGWARDVLEGDDPDALGIAVAQRLLAAGAGELLGR